jgi:hypothetical protein
MITSISYTIHDRPRTVNGKIIRETVQVQASYDRVSSLLLPTIHKIQDGKLQLPVHLPEYGITITEIEESKE